MWIIAHPYWLRCAQTGLPSGSLTWKRKRFGPTSFLGWSYSEVCPKTIHFTKCSTVTISAVSVMFKQNRGVSTSQGFPVLLLTQGLQGRLEAIRYRVRLQWTRHGDATGAVVLRQDMQLRGLEFGQRNVAKPCQVTVDMGDICPMSIMFLYCLALIHWSSCCLRSDCKAAVRLLSGYEQTGDALWF